MRRKKRFSLLNRARWMNMALFPEFIGSLSKLRYLNLSCGTPSIPHLQDLSGLHFNLSTSIENLISITTISLLLQYLSLPSTELEGGIPKFFGNSCSLNILRLPFNYLNGQLSELIQSLSGGCMVNSLESLYLGANDLTGPIPDFGGFSSLKELRLRENRLNGTINKSLSQLSKHDLSILDLANNSFSGKIPNSMGFLPITQERSSNPTIGFGLYVVVHIGIAYEFSYLDTLQWTWKGSENEYENTLGLVKCLDLSNNNLCGAIPEEIMDVLGLIASNLSRNNLIGAIPPKIGQNRFSGSIPSGLAQLSRLGVLDLSDNSSFNPSVYAGNLELCGLPLQNKCPDEESAPCPGIEDDANTPEDEDDQFITRILHELDSWFLCWILGVCGTLMLNQLLEWYERFALCDSSCEYCNTAKKVQELIKR
ncbi:Leucine Rich Repeat family protein expressed [Citrus sinensis]|nr:Leucine Rich Repeat family protein expressed [Citrus sinensis]